MSNAVYPLLNILWKHVWLNKNDNTTNKFIFNKSNRMFKEML